MSSPVPDPGAVPDEPNFTELPSQDPPAPGEPAVPNPDPDPDPEDGTTAG